MAGGRSVARCLVAACMLFLPGCAPTWNLHPARHAVDPRVRADPGHSLPGKPYRTFSVFPLSWIALSAKLKDADAEQQILFSLRNAFEGLGYRFVAPEASPDFFVTVDAAFSARLPAKPKPETAIPLDMAHPALLRPVPLESIIDFSGTVPGRVRWLDDASRDYQSADWANWKDPRLKPPLAPVPLFPDTGERKEPGLLTGAAHGLLVREDPAVKTAARAWKVPQVWIIAVDARSHDEIWAATAAGATREPRLAVAAQLPVWAAVRAFPRAMAVNDRVEEAYGFRWEILSNDGVCFFPAVVAVAGASPAAAAGLQPGDFIVNLGGRSTANLPRSAFADLLANRAPGAFGVSIWRRGREVSSFLSSPGVLADPAFRPARTYPVREPPALGLGW